MRNEIIGLLLMMSAVSAARADDASQAVSMTNAPQPATAVGAPQPTTSVNTQPPVAAASFPQPLAPSHDRGRWGAGAILGEPTGFSTKFWLSDKTAVDGAAAWSFADPDGFQVHGDFLYHKFDLFRVNRGELPLYFGVGGRVKFVEHHDNRAGIRFPVGVSYLFADQPLEFFVEVAPILDVAPATQLRFNGGIGIRYYFH